MAGDLRNAIGVNLRSLRAAQGLTQEAFAHRYRLDRAWVGRVETSKRNLTIDSIEKLADKLNVEVFVLVRSPTEAPPPPPLAESHDGEAGEEAGDVEAGEEETGEDTAEETG